jgi:hypothetical protein
MKSMKRITILTLAAACLSSVFERAEAGQTLYNGIELPSPWPPKLDKLTLDPMPVPYLDAPPAVIPIDVGRQLFVDKFLIENTDLQQTFHEAKYHPDNPILKPDKPWEREGIAGGACAMPFSDGVWYDPQDQLFKMWYMGGYVYHTCLATSRDGIHWEKPSLDVRPGSNIVLPGQDLDYDGTTRPWYRDSGTVWLDLEEKDPQKRYKMSLHTPVSKRGAMSIFCSPDGIHWNQIVRSGNSGDRSTMFYNPFRKMWVYSVRDYFQPRIDSKLRKFRRYREGPDLISATANWKERTDLHLWFCLDRYDLLLPGKTSPSKYAELYNLDAVGYESLMLGLFSILRDDSVMLADKDQDRPKRNAVFAGFSRDGWHWHRPYRRPLISESEDKDAWNWGNIQSAGGCCLIVGDQLYFYVSGRAAKKPGMQSKEHFCSTGLATLRRDGFASMRAFDTEGTLTTRPVRFLGRHLFVNADVPKGELCAEILNPAGQIIQPFSRTNCIPFKGDSTKAPIRWKGADDLSALAGKPVRFRFYLTGGDLYAFWVSPDASGASHGYVAAGGPGFTSNRDSGQDAR